MRNTLSVFQRDSQMRSFHAGETDELPAFYGYMYRKKLGDYAELMPVEESAPILISEEVKPNSGSIIQLL
jgi:hypothetical protein